MCSNLLYLIFNSKTLKWLNIHKHRAYHSWQLAFRNPADFMCEIWWISPEILWISWNPYEIQWISPEICQISWNLYEICWISWNPYKICWISPEICQISWNPPDFMNVSFWVMIKYRSFFRKTKHLWERPNTKQSYKKAYSCTGIP